MSKVFRFSVVVPGIVLAGICILSPTAWANSEQHSGGFLSILFPLINFFIFVAVMFSLLKGAVSKAWGIRRDSLQASFKKAERMLAEASEAKALAEAAQARLEQRMEQVRSEIGQLVGRELKELRSLNEDRIENLRRDHDLKLQAYERVVFGKLLEETIGSLLENVKGHFSDSSTMSRFNSAALGKAKAIAASGKSRAETSTLKEH
jgi:F0F1-type ATP synthase membrane subunit b/b'